MERLSSFSRLTFGWVSRVSSISKKYNIILAHLHGSGSEKKREDFGRIDHRVRYCAGQKIIIILQRDQGYHSGTR